MTDVTYVIVANILFRTIILFGMIYTYKHLYGANGRLKAQKEKFPRSASILKVVIPLYVIYFVYAIVKELLMLWAS